MFLTRTALNVIRQSKRQNTTLWRFYCRLHNMARCSVKRRGAGNKLMADGALLAGVRIYMAGTDNVIEIGKGTRLKNVSIQMRGSGHRLTIGENCTLTGTLWFEDIHGIIRIHDHVYIGKGSLAVTEEGSISIGANCMLSSDVDIRNGDSHSILRLSDGLRINDASDVTIADRVWIGHRATILKGVTIGAGSVIATGAIVTHSIPSCVIAAGVPARIVKEGVSWDPVRINNIHASH